MSDERIVELEAEIARLQMLLNYSRNYPPRIYNAAAHVPARVYLDKDTGNMILDYGKKKNQ